MNDGGVCRTAPATPGLLNITVKSVKIVPPVRTSKTTTKDTQKFARNLPQDNADSKVIAPINIWSPPQVKNKMRWLKG